MRIYDIIAKKRDKKELSKQEIEFFINGYINGKIADYQASALLMAIYLNNMTDEETTNLTLAIKNSGDVMDLTEIDKIKVDKHSTGGVGDKTTLIVAPIVAACGGAVAKLSGRGLGHTGGTLDKLQALPNFSVSLTRDNFITGVKKNGLCVAGQTENITPADKMLYSLRDVTATINSIPLIASSIMSKKLASGADKIVLDVKTGSGAFMKSLEDSVLLAEKMVAIGNLAGKETIAIITDMDTPLGCNLGNSLEIIEAIDVLNGKGPEDLLNVCLKLASNMLVLCEIAKNEQQGEVLARQVINNKAALNKFCDMVDFQGSSRDYVLNYNKLSKAKNLINIISKTEGYIKKIDTEKCGLACVAAGAGREKKEDIIDYSAGVVLMKKTGEYVKCGDVLMTLHTNKDDYNLICDQLLSCYCFSKVKPEERKLIFAKVDKDSTVYY